MSRPPLTIRPMLARGRRQRRYSRTPPCRSRTVRRVEAAGENKADARKNNKKKNTKSRPTAINRPGRAVFPAPAYSASVRAAWSATGPHRHARVTPSSCRSPSRRAEDSGSAPFAAVVVAVIASQPRWRGSVHASRRSRRPHAPLALKASWRARRPAPGRRPARPSRCLSAIFPGARGGRQREQRGGRDRGPSDIFRMNFPPVAPAQSWASPNVRAGTVPGRRGALIESPGFARGATGLG